MAHFVPDGPRYNVREEDPPDNGPDMRYNVREEDPPDNGPEDPPDNSADRHLTLQNNDEKCTLTVEGYTVKAIFEPLLAAHRPKQRTWHHVSAFVSTFVSSLSNRNENDKWVVSIVHCLDPADPHVKWISDVFETHYITSYHMRQSLKTWVLERGFDFLLQDIR
jgi:hypothetical protein